MDVQQRLVFIMAHDSENELQLGVSGSDPAFRSTAPWGLCRHTVNTRDAWCQSSVMCWRKWRASLRSTLLSHSWWGQDGTCPTYAHCRSRMNWKPRTLPIVTGFFCFAAHRLSLRCCHSLAQGAALFPKVFLPKAAVNEHKGTFVVSFLPYDF